MVVGHPRCHETVRRPRFAPPVYHDEGQGLAVIAYAGDSINDALTFLSITFDSIAYSPSGMPLMSVADQYNALNNGEPYAGYPTAGYWTATFPTVTDVPEPAAWSMLIVGFMGVGLQRRKAAIRRAQPA